MVCTSSAMGPDVRNLGGELELEMAVNGMELDSNKLKSFDDLELRGNGMVIDLNMKKMYDNLQAGINENRKTLDPNKTEALDKSDTFENESEMNTNEPKSFDDLELKIRENEIEFVRVEVADINGISRGCTLDARYFLRTGRKKFPIQAGHVLRGIEGTIPSGIDVIESLGGSKTLASFDYITFRVLPYVENTASIFVDFKIPSLQTPRSFCMEQIEKLNNLGLDLFSAFEFAFYLSDIETGQPLDDGKNKGATIKNNTNTALSYDLMRNLRNMGMDPEAMMAAGGAGQWEITLSPKWGIEAVDNAFRFKSCIKEISGAHDMSCTFMSKPYERSDSGAHFNHSLWDIETKSTVLFDAKDDRKMSELAKYWIAGMQHHAKGLMALLCPTTNCYRRIAAKSWPPIHTWGLVNQKSAIRFKSYGENSTYIENRIPSSACNPYIVTAAIIIAGMDGINRKMNPSKEINGIEKVSVATAKIIPTTLEEALQCLKQDGVLVQEFGADFIHQFCLVKELELQDSRQAANNNRLHEWEREVYWTYV